MIKTLKNFCKRIFLIILFFSSNIFSDSYFNNSYNNHGVVGLINIPTARTYDEGVHGLILYDGTPDQKITLSSNPYDWLEASFFIAIFKVDHIQDMNFKTIKIKDLI